MSTQHTGKNPPQNTEEIVNIAGRDMRPANLQAEMQRSIENAGSEYPDEQFTPMAPPPQMEPGAKEQVDAMLPDFLREQQPAPVTTGDSQKKGDRKEALAAMLAEQVIEARKKGDNAFADKLKNLIGDTLEDVGPKRVRKPKPVHPALQKLRQNLGLQRIQPTTVKWGDQKWHLAPAPPAIDHWAIQVAEEGISNYSILKLAGSIVGIDNAPLYEVFGIEMQAEYQPTDGSQPIIVQVYDKQCDACGETIDVSATVCPACTSMHDPYDMPLNLRLRCADEMHKFFINDFGPYEELRQLYVLMREEMKDRLADKEELYGPFLKLSDVFSTTTDTTPSGAEPAPD